MPPTLLDRRRLLALGLQGSAAAALAPSWLAAAGRAAAGADPSGRRLVVLELFGGNDGLNTLVPFEDDHYRAARPRLGLAKSDVLGVDELHGLHPSLRRLHAWYERGAVGLVRGVGYPGPNLSHFASRDVWSTASTAGVLPDSGWLGSYLHQGRGADPLAAIAVGSDSTPRLAQHPLGGAAAVPDLASYRFELGQGTDAREGRARLEAFQAVVGGGARDPELDHAREVVALAGRTSTALARAVRTRRPAEYPNTKLGRDLAATADVIAAGLPTRVFHVVHPGFDTHTRQAAVQERLLHELDLALDAFLSDLRALGQLEDTLVLTTSEFGRRLAESGVGSETGTDHGAASLQMLVGGRARPGLHGEALDLSAPDENGNPIARVDFRSVLASVLDGWLRVDADAVLGAAHPRLPLLEST